ncbi:MAG: hypothetical protein F6K07_33475 [Okeania sp. SIO1H5]|uniref:hypothetical protein n=1 Tax=Okeania sp. SIO1H5 TaxID=2607777 RepID=UPI0013BCE7F0|nr:hypothetical protein [Okeania sp. SIO1H5]NET23896.1 hypothetical protein [Okeania sp. SIO1H5]
MKIQTKKHQLSIWILVFTIFSHSHSGHPPQELVGSPPFHGKKPLGNILMIAANPAVSKKTGWPIGCWAAELVHPYHAFTQAGYHITIASPQGGKIEFDSYSDPRDESGYSAHDLMSVLAIS